MTPEEWKAFAKFAAVDLAIAWFIDERIAVGFVAVVAVIWTVKKFSAAPATPGSGKGKVN